MNDLSIAEWQHNISEFNKPVSEGGGRIGQEAQVNARVEAGGVPGDGTAILHGPDQIAGGRPDTFDGLGSSSINSSIGGQWGSRIISLRRDINDVQVNIPVDLQRFVHLNVRLFP